MSSRSELELRLLDVLRESRRPVPARLIAEHLGISERSVRNYVSSINASAERRVISSGNRGYLLRPDAHRRYRAASARETAADVPQRRLDALLHALVTGADADVYELAERFSVSDATVESDLVKARAIAREHGLRLVREHERVRLTGPARQKRLLARSLILTGPSGGVLDVLTQVREEPQGWFARLHSETKAVLGRHGLRMNQYMLADLVVHLAVTIQQARARQSAPVEDHSSPPDARTPRTTVVEALVDAVEAIGHCRLSAEEREGVKERLTALTGGEDAGTAARQHTDARAIVAESLHRVAREHGLEWSTTSPHTALERHLEQLLQRARVDRQMTQSLGLDFQHTHPVIYELTIQFVSDVEHLAGVTLAAGEVDLLAFHLGAEFQRQLDAGPRVALTVLLPDYVQLGRRFRDRLDQELDDVAFVEDSYEDATSDLRDASGDLIVSTVPLTLPDHRAVVTISPIPSADDVARVRDAVREERARQRRATARSALIRLLDPELFDGIDTARTAAEAIAHGCALLRREGYVEEGFEGDVLERERRASTAFPARFAIPHSLHMNARRTGVAVLRPESPIEWSGHSVRIVIMFAVAPEGAAAFREVLELFIELFDDPSRLDQVVRAAGSYESLVPALLTLLA